MTDRQTDRQTDRTISLIRLISFISIILCHLCQALELELAWWLNVGVQIFLCISGYLYGKKNEIIFTSFYHQRLKKILIPYYIIIVTMIFLGLSLGIDGFRVKNIISSLLIKGSIPGGNHLWFISNILMCYAIIPVLNGIYNTIFNKNSLKACCFSIILANYFFIVHCRSFNSDAITCFIIAYYIGTYESMQNLIPTRFIYEVGVLAIILNVSQIYLQYFSGLFLTYNHDNTVIETLIGYNHTSLGIFLFLIMHKYFKFINYENIILKSLLDYSDRYSYYGYLVHHFFIIGPFSIIFLTNNMLMNICIILFLIIMVSIILCEISSNFILRFFYKINR